MRYKILSIGSVVSKSFVSHKVPRYLILQTFARWLLMPVLNFRKLFGMGYLNTGKQIN